MQCVSWCVCFVFLLLLSSVPYSSSWLMLYKTSWLILTVLNTLVWFLYISSFHNGIATLVALVAPYCYCHREDGSCSCGEDMYHHLPGGGLRRSDAGYHLWSCSDGQQTHSLQHQRAGQLCGRFSGGCDRLLCLH